MIHFKFSDKDNRYLYIKYDDHTDYLVLQDLQTKMNLVDPKCYLANYSGPRVTQDFLFEYKQPDGSLIFYCSIGLWQYIWKYLKSNNIPFDGLDEKYLKRPIKHTFDEFKAIVDSWGMSRTPRPYQYESAYKILQWNKSVLQLATRAGKTLIAYMVFRYCSEYLGTKRILMIVPSIDLVKQGYNDFNEYAEYFKTECLWGGGKLVESSNLTIGTFSTLISFLDRKNKKYNPHFFDTYDIVFVDETHRANAASIKNIISQPFMQKLKIAFGMTGTLPKENTTERFCVHALLGALIKKVTPAELMEEGYISKVKIYQHRLHYPEPTKEKPDYRQVKTWIRCAEYCLSEFVTVPNKKNPRKKDKVLLENPEFLIAYKKQFPDGLYNAKRSIAKQIAPMEDKIRNYQKLLQNAVKASPSANLLHIEIMMAHFFEERVDYLLKILDDCPRNTLILAQHREYIKHVYDRIKEKYPDRPVLYVIGGSKDRKIVKEVLANNNNCILVAGYSIMGTGITLSNLCYGVLFESFKSNVINMQSIGRGLGLSDMKEEYVLHDITDCFSKKEASNKIYYQGLERIKIYENPENKYPYEIIDHYFPSQYDPKDSGEDKQIVIDFKDS